MFHRFRRWFRKPTREALLLRDALQKRGLRVLTEVDDGHKHIDLGIPDAHMNIEVDGRQHLTSARQILSDLSRSHYSDDLGYDTIHIHNEEIRTSLEPIANAIVEAANIRSENIKR